MKRIFKITLGFGVFMAHMHASHANMALGTEVASSSTYNAVTASDVIETKTKQTAAKVKTAAKVHTKTDQAVKGTETEIPAETHKMGVSLDKDGFLNPSMEGRGIVPFVSVEGFPVWINFGGITVSTTKTSNTANKGTYVSGGARVGAGFAYAYQSNVDLTAEAAWNYFGSTTGTVGADSISATLSGVDMLVGASYKKNKYELFAKVGALFERLTYNIKVPNLSLGNIEGTDYILSMNTGAGTTDVLPEIKVGMNYNYNASLAATIAYMHAFGASPSATLSSMTTGSTVLAGIKTDLKGATLNSVLFGLRYRFLNS